MYSIEVDERTFHSIELASRLTGIPASAVVARLVEASLEAPTATTAQSVEVEASELAGDDPREWIAVYNDYAGHRTSARLFPLTGRVEIVSGPLAGQQASTPSHAARMVVSHYKPGVDPNRNGWAFWLIDDGSGRTIQAVRRVDRPDQQIPRLR